jgi:hypothetical protein
MNFGEHKKQNQSLRKYSSANKRMMPFYHFIKSMVTIGNILPS